MLNCFRIFLDFCDFFGIQKYFLYSITFRVLKVEYSEPESIRKNLEKIVMSCTHKRVPANKFLVNFETYRESTSCKVKKS